MARPSVITVLGQRFTLTWESEEAGLLNEPDKSGRTDHMRQQMHIREGMGFHQERETVLHELLHVAWNLAQLPADDSQERSVGTIAPILLELIRRDVKLVEWLCESDE